MLATLTWTEILFWIAAALVVYTYVGYPVLVWALGRWHPHPTQTAPLLPTITVLIAAYNEEASIAEKIENCLQLMYPPDRLDILVVSDGSTDRTVEIAASYAAQYPQRVSVIAMPVHRGKAAALNVGAARAAGEILLLADVRQRFDPYAAQALARNFADATVGAVSGELLLVGETEAALGAEAAAGNGKDPRCRPPTTPSPLSQEH